MSKVGLSEEFVNELKWRINDVKERIGYVKERVREIDNVRKYVNEWVNYVNDVVDKVDGLIPNDLDGLSISELDKRFKDALNLLETIRIKDVRDRVKNDFTAYNEAYHDLKLLIEDIIELRRRVRELVDRWVRHVRTTKTYRIKIYAEWINYVKRTKRCDIWVMPKCVYSLSEARKLIERLMDESVLGTWGEDKRWVKKGLKEYIVECDYWGEEKLIVKVVVEESNECEDNPNGCEAILGDCGAKIVDHYEEKI